jgi:hypothetical protein
LARWARARARSCSATSRASSLTTRWARGTQMGGRGTERGVTRSFGLPQASTVGAAFLTKTLPELNVKFEIWSVAPVLGSAGARASQEARSSLGERPVGALLWPNVGLALPLRLQGHGRTRALPQPGSHVLPVGVWAGYGRRCGRGLHPPPRIAHAASAHLAGGLQQQSSCTISPARTPSHVPSPGFASCSGRATQT